MSNDILEYHIGDRTFRLDRAKAEQTLSEKKIICGRVTHAFNILPIRYQWAYDLYKTMKNNHWEPEEVEMQKDIEQWRNLHDVKDQERWIIKMAIGYFSCAEGIVGDNIQHVMRELVTASEVKLLLGRHAHEENIHADSLVFMLSSLGIDPHECEAIFEDIPSIRAKNEFIGAISHRLRRDLDLSTTENKQLLAKNAFAFGQCMEGTQFYGLFGMVLALGRRGLFPGICEMFSYTLRDESNHIDVFRNCLIAIRDENPEIWTQDFQDDLVETMKSAVELEKTFIRDCLPLNIVGLKTDDFCQYIDFVADVRLQSVGLPPLHDTPIANPLPWLAEAMDIRREANFFERRVTEYRKGGGLPPVSDDDLA